jgi:hypothetical protein
VVRTAAESKRSLTANGTPARPPSARPLRYARSEASASSRALRTQGDERSELRVELGDPGEQRVDHLDGRQRALAIRGEQLVRREAAEFGAGGQPIPY